jgi:hypothetical protein
VDRNRPVIQHGIKQQERANREEARADNRYDLMHTRSRTPSKHEQTNRNTEASNDCRRKSLLWLQLTFFVELRLLDFIQLVEVRDDYDGVDGDANERETFLAEREAVDADEEAMTKGSNHT